ncbi:STAS domain-containing protein [Streptomyces sp. NPDC093589]|uniref:STAS domain-containing protein n=1 Tax=Streptomyces sp. NPDC093589 TaxID=3366043 RepID=UPI0038018D3E
MADTPSASVQPQRATVAITEADEQRAVLTFSGALDAHDLPELEELLGDRRLRQAGSWIWDMSDLQRIDLACAYALLRAVTRAPESVSVATRGARHAVQRTLRHAGLDTVVTTIEE